MTSLHPFGPTFKKLREARGYSLKEAAGDIVSPQFLSQFENEKKGMSLENFSRLLISIGVDWDDFVRNYTGDRVNILDIFFDEAFNEVGGQLDSVVKVIKNKSQGYLADNENLKDIYFKATSYRYETANGYKDDKSVYEPYLSYIRELPIDAENGMENNLRINLLGLLPLELVIENRDYCLEVINTTSSDTELQNYLALLLRIVGHFSKNGFYIECEKTIEKLNKIRRLDARLPLLTMLLFDIYDVYNLLRQGKKEGVTRFRKVSAMMNAAIELGNFSDQIIIYKNQFEVQAMDLNKTGLPLHDI